MSRVQFIIMGVTVIVLLFSLILLLQNSGITKTKPTQITTSPTPVPTTITGFQIAKQTALFLDTTLKEDGDVEEVYECKVGENLCTKTDRFRDPTVKGYVAKAYYELFQVTGEKSYEKKAKRVANFILKACSKNKAECFRNTPPLYYLYNQTKDPRYRDAILKVADDMYNYYPDMGYVIDWTNRGERLAILYELTGDKKYKDRLETIAQDLLAHGYNNPDPENTIFYQEGDLVIKTYSIQIIWDNYLQAYRVSKNPIYLQAAKDFFRKANIEAHFSDFFMNTNLQDLNFISGLLVLRDAIDDPKEKEIFSNYAHRLAQRSYVIRSDTPQNQKFTGDYGFLHFTDPANNIKVTIQSALRISQYLRMANETFNIK